MTESGDDPLVFVMRDMFDGAPVTTVFHERDGDWQYLTGSQPSPENAQMVHRSHVHAIDPSLAELMSMPSGTWAARHGPGEPWSFGEDED